MKCPRTKYSEHRMSELGDLQGREVTRLFQAARTDDDLLAMQLGVAFLASRFTPEAVLEVGDSAEPIAWARGAVRRMWAEYAAAQRMALAERPNGKQRPRASSFASRSRGDPDIGRQRR